MVIIAIALVSILASVLLSLSLLNYQMKITEKNAKETFYSAEEALDQIHAGLQSVVSEAMDKAYMQAIQQYKYSGITEADRIQNFKNTFSMAVRKDIKRADTDAYYLIGGPYDAARDVANAGLYGRDITSELYTKGLVKYLDKTLAGYLASGRLTIGSRVEEIGGVKNYLAEVKYTTEGMVLKDIIVGYTDDDGYYSEIQTDILIGFPSISLRESTVLPNVFSYAFIVDDSLVFDRVDGAVVSNNVYAGQLVLDNCVGTVKFDNVDYLVCEGDVTVNKSSLNVVSENFWANSLSVVGSSTKGVNQYSSSLYLDGAAYVADDLTLQQNNITAELSGKYYGYSGRGAEDMDVIESKSAIQLNCANATLDMESLDTLMLCGNSYINGANVTLSRNGALLGTASPIMMGTSVSTKVDQIAFLAPVECLGTLNGQSIIGRNPMTEEEYNLWNTYSETGYQKLNTNVETAVTGKKLSDYGFKSYDNTNTRTIFRQIGSETVVYVYLNFSSEDKASEYYRDYKNNAEDLLNTYMSKYQNTILYDGADEEYTRGNVISYVPPVNEEALGSNRFTVIENSIDSTTPQDELNDLSDVQTEYKNSFRALCAKLTTNFTGLQDGEKDKSVYENIINESVLAGMPSNVPYFTSWASDTYRSLVINNADAVEVGTDAAGDYAKCVLVIATGDVVIKGNFNGLIIAGGKVTVPQSTNVTISSNEMVVENLLKATIVPEDLAWGGKTVIETYFKDGSKYVTSSTGDDSAYVSLENVIAYLNWTKQ